MQAYKAISAMAEEARAQERQRITAAIEALLGGFYAQYNASLDAYAEGAIDALAHALYVIDKKDTKHE